MITLQFTYLIFIKSLDDKQLQSEAEANLLGIKPDIIFDEEHEDLTCFWQEISHLLQVGDELPGIDSYDFIRHTIISIK